jgi:hypothetical protein
MEAPPVKGPEHPILMVAAPSAAPLSLEPLSLEPPQAAKVNTIASASAMTINFLK